MRYNININKTIVEHKQRKVISSQNPDKEFMLGTINRTTNGYVLSNKERTYLTIDTTSPLRLITDTLADEPFSKGPIFLVDSTEIFLVFN